MKCLFDPGAGATACNGCRRRGSPCVSQEFPEPEDFSVAQDKTAKAGDNGRRTGSLHASRASASSSVRNSIIPSEGCREERELLTPVSTTSDSPRQTDYHEVFKVRYPHFAVVVTVAD